ncbi:MULTISPECIES: hypothetical protein [unclassified Methylobacterium]|uniref:hypothetical protein n=1 Tax=unclassified Methylobacterium TaxID=2615210 RepID=UPI0011C1D6FF|nr:MULTISPECIES: hypothetical protein [unclassified Methylobacterium]QEE39916.1 hypothetical protein FVA80_14080 [Methylobacterium sp. WL1]TXN56582.1 hypothetical protein FV241_14735 [Methylobacterium sp. WL2]
MAKATHAIVCQATRVIVSRHASLDYARAAWRKRAYPGGRTDRPLTRWASLHHITPIAQAQARAPQEAAA